MRSPPATPAERLISILSDVEFLAALDHACRTQGRAGPRARTALRARVGDAGVGGRLKAFHALDGPFVFETIDVGAGRSESCPRSFAPDRRELDGVRTQRKTPQSGDPALAAYRVDDRATLVLDRECRVKTDYGFEPRLLWKEIAVFQQESAETIAHPCASKVLYRQLLICVSILIFVVRNHAVSEQAGKIVGVFGIAQENRLGHMEDFLHGAHIGRVRERDRAGKRHAVHVGVSQG
jgi:hypothetical protein